ncbi:MAG: hypothetical protein H0T18_01555 [Chloroflexia bacterium]|nr:hypothetical protein [Chloroflexia bacterium]
MTTDTGVDSIDALAGIGADSAPAALRRLKPDLVAFAQGSDEALLAPADPGSVSLLERHAIAYRIGIVTGFETVAARHRARLTSLGADDDLIAAIAAFPRGDGLDPRLTALLAHTDRVTRAPGGAAPEHIAALRAAGLSPAAIVTVAQLIGFLAYQIRAIAVARAFGAE